MEVAIASHRCIMIIQPIEEWRKTAGDYNVLKSPRGEDEWIVPPKAVDEETGNVALVIDANGLSETEAARPRVIYGSEPLAIEPEPVHRSPFG